MYKTFAFLLLVAVVGIAVDVRTLNIQSSHIQRVVSPIKSKDNGLDWCPQCIDTFNDLIEVVLDIILQYGVVDSCGHLCDLVTEKTGSGILGFMCAIGCDVLGLEEFSKLVQEADLDPIYYCETVKLFKDNGDCKFKSFAVIPARAKTESTITLDMMFVSTNGTGTGELILMIQTVDKIPISTGFLLEEKKPGTYAESFTIDTTPDPDCDPTQSQCEMWLEGTYNVTVLLCNGQCGAHHPHTSVYDTAHGNFTLYEE